MKPLKEQTNNGTKYFRKEYRFQDMIIDVDHPAWWIVATQDKNKKMIEAFAKAAIGTYNNKRPLLDAVNWLSDNDVEYEIEFNIDRVADYVEVYLNNIHITAHFEEFQLTQYILAFG